MKRNRHQGLNVEFDRLCIDATLVNEKKELTPRTKEALIKLHEKGIYFVSGRADVSVVASDGQL